MQDASLLYCLDKATLQILNREHGNTPATILARTHYYRDDDIDIDDTLIRPLEDRLAPLVKRIASDPDTAIIPSEHFALIDWCALAISRSQFIEDIDSAVYDSLTEMEREGVPVVAKRRQLLARLEVFKITRDMMRRERVQIRFLIDDHDNEYVITDHPPMPILIERPCILAPTLVPISNRVIMVVCPQLIAEHFFARLDARWGTLLLLQCGFAKRLIYSTSIKALESAAMLMAGADPEFAALGAMARVPYMGRGTPEAVTTAIRSRMKLADEINGNTPIRPDGS